MAADARLIFDIGLHVGVDTSFYLAKGFRVIGVEAMASLCEEVQRDFSAEVESGRLTIVNSAIADRPGPVTFYAHPISVWGTIRPAWANRNEQVGAGASTAITVPGITFGELLQEHGVPYFMKIDIEGADMLCLEGLRGASAVPEFVSIESDKSSWTGLVHEFDVLNELGYRRFKIVPQHKVHRQRLPEPAREGVDIPWRFAKGASGAFGEEAPGEWMTREQALRRYKMIFARYRTLGDRSPLRRGRLRPLGRAIGHLAGSPWWYDTHAGR